MKVQFTRNLGSRDANNLGLDSTKCTDGSTVDVSDDAAQWLADRGIATPVTESTKKSKGDPPAEKN